MMKFLIATLMSVFSASAMAAQADCSPLYDHVCKYDVVVKGAGEAAGRVLEIFEDGRALFDADDVGGARITPTMVSLATLFRAVPALAGLTGGMCAVVDGEHYRVNTVFSNNVVELTQYGNLFPKFADVSAVATEVCDD